MIGDKLVITEYHRKGATMAFDKLLPLLKKSSQPMAASVGGESGCGKSETAAVLAELAAETGFSACILQQDDYFVLPPKTNHNHRVEDIGWVGMQEVRLDLMDEHLKAVKNRAYELKKPLVDFENDTIGEEFMSVEGSDLVIAEGTYTLSLESADFRVFIDRTYHQTKLDRLRRARDPDSAFIERVLEIEHEIISKFKEKSDVVIPPEF